jgi:hypothetical protein
MVCFRLEELERDRNRMQDPLMIVGTFRIVQDSRRVPGTGTLTFSY